VSKSEIGSETKSENESETLRVSVISVWVCCIRACVGLGIGVGAFVGLCVRCVSV
jgi:hypothetical protein